MTEEAIQESTESNVVPLFAKTSSILTFSCLTCPTTFEREIDQGAIQNIPCPVCTKLQTVPFTIAPRPDECEFDTYVCGCGCEFFRSLSDNCSQCINCGEITEPA